MSKQPGSPIEVCLVEHKRPTGATADLSRLCEDLRAVSDEHFHDLRCIHAIVPLSRHQLIYGQFGDDSTTNIRKIFLSNNNLSVFFGSENWIGYLHPNIDVDYQLNNVYAQFSAKSQCLLEDYNTVRFISRVEDLENHSTKLYSIVVKHPWDRRRAYYDNVDSNGVCVRSSSNSSFLARLLDSALATNCWRVLRQVYGILLAGEKFDRSIRDEKELIYDLLACSPATKERFRSCQNNVYFCDVETNVWAVQPKGTVEQNLVAFMKIYVPALTPTERDHIDKKRNQAKYRKEMYDQVYEPSFVSSLKQTDSNAIFATTNGCFRVGSDKFTQIQLEDRVSITCGWFYDPQKAEQHLQDVHETFCKLFPIPEERHVVLVNMASNLHGIRKDKRLLMLTDSRNGNNGKSSFLNINEAVFGNYFSSSTKFVCKSSLESDRNSHDAGMASMQGKRVVAVDELKFSSHLDVGFLKRIAGGVCKVSGRHFNSSETFEYTWQAGLILVFNEGDCPKFDAGDGAFMKRVLVCPMRSKFIDITEDDPSTYTYKRDDFFDEKILLWRSAFLKYLLQYRSMTGLANFSIPDSIIEARNELFEMNNPLYDWLLDRLEETGNSSDMLSLKELWELFVRNGREKRMSIQTFQKYAKVVLSTNKITVTARYQSTCDVKRTFYRNVIFGYKIRSE